MNPRARYGGRKLRNQVFAALSTGAGVIGIAWLAVILWTLLVNGISALGPDLFLMTTAPPDERGGLANAIMGSLEMILLAMLVGTPIGVMTGTYLAEYGRHTKLAYVLRTLNDILLSTPSILIGLFVYQMIVLTTKHYSGLAGAVALAVIVVPVVVRTTENMLLLVPNALREAASALGAPSAFVIRHVTWKSARAGIVTGVLLAVARISGETAPLLFTAFGNEEMTLDVTKPMASLPVIIYRYTQDAHESWHQLAWGGALIITVTVLGVSIVARLVGPKRS